MFRQQPGHATGLVRTLHTGEVRPPLRRNVFRTTDTALPRSLSKLSQGGTRRLQLEGPSVRPLHRAPYRELRIPLREALDAIGVIDHRTDLEAFAGNATCQRREREQKLPIQCRLAPRIPLLHPDPGPTRTTSKTAMHFDGHFIVPTVFAGAGKAGSPASTSNAFPHRAGRAPRLAVQNLADREAVADALQHAKKVEEVRLATGVRADEQVHAAEGQIDAPQALEVLDDDAVDHHWYSTWQLGHAGAAPATGAVVEPDEPPRGSRPSEFAGVRHGLQQRLPPPFRVAGYLTHRPRERLRFRRREPSGVSTRTGEHAAGVGPRQGNAGSHRLERADAKRLPRVQVHEQVDVGERVGEPPAVGYHPSASLPEVPKTGRLKARKRA